VSRSVRTVSLVPVVVEAMTATTTWLVASSYFQARVRLLLEPPAVPRVSGNQQPPR